MHDLLQESRDAQYLGVEPPQCRDDFETFGWNSIPESYLEGRVSIVLELAPKRNLNPLRNGSSQRCKSEAIHLPVFLLQFYAIDRQDIHNWDEQMVLIVNVEPMNSANIGVSSLTRFHALNHEFEEARIGQYFSCLLEHRFKVLPVFTRREFDFGIVSSGTERLNSVGPCNIQSALEIVDCVSNRQCMLSADVLLSKAVKEELSPRTRIDVKRQVVGVFRGKESLLDVRDVLIGPFDFEGWPCRTGFPKLRA